MATIVCLACGTTTSGPKHKKLCGECRLLTDIEYWYRKQGTCSKALGGCGATFNPVRRADPVCGDCAPGQSVNRGSCNLCGESDTYRLHRDVAVCERCARDPAKRIKFIGGLRKRQARRRTAAGWSNPNE